MRTFLFQIRYYLELIALPAFIFLVIHLSGHGLVALTEKNHDHEHHEEIHTGIDFDIHELAEKILTVEILGGILLLIFFTWLWHRPNLKKWVPCNHDHCHHKPEIPHLLAIFALCLHFFPEAGIRYELLQKAFEGGILNILGLLGFGAHFLVDVIVAGLISSYWSTSWARWTSFGVIALVWLVALGVSESFMDTIPSSAEPILFLISAFLLSMFVHKPHKPIKECHHCD
ncbi:hypothetical protein K9L27_00805 [Candidatus Gracilibacteria bacterium]|nr:hypothetical protein [Candidatus Gracilibacteria bacterium]